MLKAATDALSEICAGPDTRLCVALSGGVDSVVLLDVIHRLRGNLGFQLTAAHVNHGISANAAQWAGFCTQLCEQLGVPCACFELVVPRGDPAGLEAAARRLRHAALDSLPVDWMLFAHHADDQAETVLFRLARGAGVRGLAGMRAVTLPANGRVARLRPLLGVRRKDILAYARQRGLQWVEDESNADLRFSRNFLRARVLPPLEEGFAGAVDCLRRAAVNLAEADTLLESLAEIDRANCGPNDDGWLVLKAVLALPDARIFNLLRSEIRRLGLAPPARSRLQECVRQMRSAVDHPLHLPMGEAACCVYRGRLWLEPVPVGLPSDMDCEGWHELPWGTGVVRFENRLGEGVSLVKLQSARVVSVSVRWEGLTLRAGPGRPRRSLRKLCQDAGLPPWWRDNLPVLKVDGEAAWVGGLGVAGDFVCSPDEAGMLPVWLHSVGPVTESELLG